MEDFDSAPCRLFPGKSLCSGQAACLECGAIWGVNQHAPETIDESSNVVRVKQMADPMKHLGQRPTITGDHCRPACHGLDCWESKAFEIGRQYQGLGRSIKVDEVCIGDKTCEMHAVVNHQVRCALPEFLVAGTEDVSLIVPHKHQAYI